ncbi:RsiV family protein [Nocardia noduli]|uniref:RsiV family protein n=1 Tax=Nocardia noduli TaxID=2815722 RepID=UPI001C21F02D|nr:RsiV family protein [Nocardia noduli]
MKKLAAALAVAAVLTATMTACAAGLESGAAAAPPAGVPTATAPGGYCATTLRLTGPGYELDVPQVSGGTEVARDAFNTAMRGLARQWIDQVEQTFTLKPGSGQVTYLGSRAISSLFVISTYSEGAAHPNNAYESYVIDARTGDEITLDDLFADVDHGLSLLADQAAIEVPKTRAGDSYSKSGIEADEYNYRLWLATPGGMEIHFGEISSHAAGDIVITVPWSKLDSALKPGMREIVGG